MHVRLEVAGSTPAEVGNTHSYIYISWPWWLNVCLTGGRGFNPRRGRQHSFAEIDHEIFSTVILPIALIQEGHLSVSGKRILVNHL